MDLDNEELKATKNKEMSADELFEELGFIKSKTNNALGYINEEGTQFVLFISGVGEPKQICIHKDDTEYPAMSMQELQAINKKVKELGWNE